MQHFLVTIFLFCVIFQKEDKIWNWRSKLKKQKQNNNNKTRNSRNVSSTNELLSENFSQHKRSEYEGEEPA